MEPVTMFAIYFGGRFVMKALGEITKSSSTSSTSSTTYYTPVKSSPPANVITLVGATGAGKSSTINALVGYSAFEVGAEHGTTTELGEVNYLNGYRLRDTPGLMDNVDFSSQVWSAFKDSKLVIYVATGQLYRPELELLHRIHNSQAQWNLESGLSNRRELALYVNKQDVKTYSMDSATRRREVLAIQEQVSAWIRVDKIAVGASSPIQKGAREFTQIDELRELILRCVQPN